MKRLGRYLLSVSDQPSESASRKPPAARSGRSSKFEKQARELVGKRASGSPALLAGSVQLLGMEDIKRCVGNRWAAVSGKAYEIADRTIRKHISDKDTFQRHNEETFILCFATPKKAEAEAKTRAIVEEIKAVLAEEAPTLKLDVSHTVAEVEWSIVEENNGSVVGAIAGALKKVREEAEQAAKAWRHDLIENATIFYSPIWNPETRIVSIYRALLGEETGKHALRQLSTVSSPEELKAALADLDCLMLGRGIEALHVLLKSGGKAQLVVPINFNTMNDKPHRETYLSLCRDIPEPYRQYIIFEIHGSVAGTPTTRIIEVALLLKTYSHGVLIEVQPSTTARLQELATTGVLGISIGSRLLGAIPSEAIAKLGKLTAAARSLNLKTFIQGADTIGIADAAVRSRADYVDGRAVAIPVAEPKAAYEWTLR